MTAKKHPYHRPRAAGPGETLPPTPLEIAAGQRLWATVNARLAAEGIPIPSDEALDRYLAERAALEEQERIAKGMTKAEWDIYQSEIFWNEEESDQEGQSQPPR